MRFEGVVFFNKSFLNFEKIYLRGFKEKISIFFYLTTKFTFIFHFLEVPFFQLYTSVGKNWGEFLI